MKILHKDGRIIACVYDADWFPFDNQSNGAAIIEIDEIGAANKAVCSDVIRYLNRVDSLGLGKYYIENGELFLRDGWVEHVESYY